MTGFEYPVGKSRFRAILKNVVKNRKELYINRKELYINRRNKEFVTIYDKIIHAWFHSLRTNTEIVVWMLKAWSHRILIHPHQYYQSGRYGPSHKLWLNSNPCIDCPTMSQWEKNYLNGNKRFKHFYKSLKDTIFQTFLLHFQSIPKQIVYLHKVFQHKRYSNTSVTRLRNRWFHEYVSTNTLRQWYMHHKEDYFMWEETWGNVGRIIDTLDPIVAYKHHRVPRITIAVFYFKFLLFGQSGQWIEITRRHLWHRNDTKRYQGTHTLDVQLLIKVGNKYKPGN